MNSSSKNNKNSITVVAVEPSKIPYIKTIDNTLESLQQELGGFIQAIYPFDDPVAIIANDEAKLIGMPLNRALRDDTGNVYDIIAGNFLVVGLGADNFASLSDELAEKYMAHFRSPEKYVSVDGVIMVIPMA